MDIQTRNEIIMRTLAKRRAFCKSKAIKHGIDGDDLFQNSVLETIALLDRHGDIGDGYVISRFRGSLGHELRRGKIDKLTDNPEEFDAEDEVGFHDPIFSAWLNKAMRMLTKNERDALVKYYWRDDDAANKSSRLSAVKRLRMIMKGEYTPVVSVDLKSPSGKKITVERNVAHHTAGVSRATMCNLINSKMEKTRKGWSIWR